MPSASLQWLQQKTCPPDTRRWQRVVAQVPVSGSVPACPLVQNAAPGMSPRLLAAPAAAVTVSPRSKGHPAVGADTQSQRPRCSHDVPYPEPWRTTLAKLLSQTCLVTISKPSRPPPPLSRPLPRFLQCTLWEPFQNLFGDPTFAE